MHAARLLLVLAVLATEAAPASAQLLPRRRPANGRVTLPELERRLVEFAANTMMEAFREGFKALGNEFGPVVDLQNSIVVFAECQMDPALIKRVDGMVFTDPKEVEKKKLFQDLAGKGCASVFLAETAKFAEKLKADRYSTPVLRKMELEYELANVSITTMPTTAASRGLSREIVAGQFWGKPEPGAKRTVKSNERLKQKEPKDPSESIIRCSFVFTTEREGKDVEKTLSFELTLDGKKPREGTSAAYAWKVANVQYK